MFQTIFIQTLVSPVVGLHLKCKFHGNCSFGEVIVSWVNIYAIKVNDWNLTIGQLYFLHTSQELQVRFCLQMPASVCWNSCSLCRHKASEGLVGFIYLLRGMLSPGRFCVCVNAQGQGWEWASPTALKSSETCSTMKASREMVVEFLFVLQQSSKAQTSIHSLVNTLQSVRAHTCTHSS